MDRLKKKHLLPIQRDFNMAILWWIATGSNKKMESDIALQYMDPRKALWTRRLTQGEIALEVNQFQLQFVVLGSGLILSIFLFFCEVIHGSYLNHMEKKLPIQKEKNTAWEKNLFDSKTLANVTEDVPGSGRAK